MTSRKPWKKVLYLRQDYPDNYTDKEFFLQDLRTQIKYVSFKEAINGASLLLEEFTTVVGFLVIYIYLINEWIEPTFILNWSCVCTFCGFVIYRFISTQKRAKNFGSDLRTVLIFVVFGHLFSPVLHTLTDTISTDTIYTMTFFMLLIHLIFFDYGVSAAIVSNSLSLSAAIFASICLASRLSSPFHAFILITVAIEFFVLFPFLRVKLHQPIVISGILLIFNVYCLSQISGMFLGVFIVSAFVINLVCPVLFVRYQKYKANIYGPWDEAVVDDAEIIYKLGKQM